jgi:hypothetical protein
MVGALLLTSGAASAAAADGKAEYELRSAQRYVAIFLSLDRNKDGVVSRPEARGDLNFSPHFDAMDIDRDGIVTAAELERYVAQQHGIRISIAQP